MAALVQIDQRFIDFAMFFGQRNFPADDIVGHLQVANLALEFLEMVGDVFGGYELMPKQ